MKVGIFLKDGNKDECVKSFIKELTASKIESFIVEGDGNIPDIYVVFGGDGTILSAGYTALNNGVPMATVNMGTVGFLSGYEIKDAHLLAKEIADNKLTFSYRSALEIEYNGKKYTALNDAVIERNKAYKGQSVVSKLSLKIGGETVYDLSSDGVIIATPTGSTAYSLSAGGVILTPDLNSFIVTPICSHSLSTRPIVYNDSEEVEITVSNLGSDCILSCDGKPVEEIKGGDKVKIRKSEKKLALAEGNYDFFSKIKRKLG